MKNCEQRMQDLLARQKVAQARRSRRRTMVLRSATAAGSVALAAAVALFVWLPGTPAKQLPAPPTASAAGSSVPAPASSADTYAPESPADAAPPAASEPTTAEVVNSAAHLSDASVASASNSAASGAPTDTKTADHNTKTPSSEPTKSVAENTKSPSSAASQSGTASSTTYEPTININEFLSIEQFNQWATAEHFRAFFTERAMDDWADDDNEIVYCYPVGLNNYPDLVFQMTTLNEGSSAVSYWYDFVDMPQGSQPNFNTGLTCFCGKLAHKKGLLDMMDKVAKRVKDGDKNYACIERDGITYYCSKSDVTKDLNVQWTQDDCLLFFHSSLFSTKYSMDWEDIIPYLTVEKVTIPLQ